MRERWARLLALSTGVVVLLLAAVFASVQNPLGSASAQAGAPSPAAASGAPPDTAAGRAVFDAQDCARCHAIAGQGSPRSPLDGVGSRLSGEEIRQWIVGADAVKDDLSPRALAAKQAYASLPAAELDALVAYLQGLRE
jgi:mono/diheme cytochrome c family protein